MALLRFGLLLVFTSVAVDSDQRKYVGCFDPNYAINHNYHHHMLPFTLNKCVTFCKTLNATYVGAEASDNFCYCGPDIPEESVRRNDSMCNDTCPGEEGTCGGEWLISVYDISPENNNHGNSQNVSFLIGTSIGSRMYHSDDLTNYDTITTSTEWAYAVDYHFARHLVFVFSSGKLFKSTLSAKSNLSSATPSLVGPMSNCEGFAVDWVRDVIYWADCARNAIMVMDLEGGNVTTLTKRKTEPRFVKRMEVDPHEGMLFWVADGVLETSTLAGENSKTNVSTSGVYVRALTLDLSNRRVYYVGSSNKSTSLYSLDYGVNELTSRDHGSLPQIRSVYGLGILGGYIYWINYANVRDVIYKAPLNSNGLGSVEILKSIDRAVWHMKLVHPDLQKGSREDPCQKMRCTHVCAPQSATTARCLCPDGQNLNEDGISCTSMHDNKTYVGCFDPSYSVSQDYNHHLTSLTLDKCVKFCVSRGIRYAGIELTENYCHCGEDLAEMSTKREDALCNTPCPGNVDLTCGGGWLISVYELAPTRNASGNDSVSYLIGLSEGVRIYDPSRSLESDELDNIMATPNWAYTVDYHYRRRLAFVSARGNLFRSTLAPKNTPVSTPTLVRTITKCEGFAVDWESNTIYWADCVNNTIMSMDIYGTNLTTVLDYPKELGQIKRMEVDPYRKKLFWTMDGTLESCDLSGAHFKTNLSVPDMMVRAISLDLPSKRVYYVATLNESTSLYYMEYSAATPSSQKAMSIPQMKSVYGLGIFRGYVYWINYANVRDVIYKAPLNASGYEHVEMVKNINKAVWHMKLIHPALQTRPEEDFVDEAMSLGQGGHSQLTVGMVVGGLMLVAMVVLLAGTLVYLVDSHWTFLHSKLFPIPRRTETNPETLAENSDSTMYNISDDNVRLI